MSCGDHLKQNLFKSPEAGARGKKFAGWVPQN